jgi:ATP-dependent Clp protease ATP-binding subunit ClpA
MTLPLNRLTPRSRKVLLLAAEVAEVSEQHYIGTEHLLWAIATGGGAASQVLEDLGVRKVVRDAVVDAIARIGPSDAVTENEADEAVVALDENPNHALRIG